MGTKIKLYDTFKHWNKKGVIWVYSDPHFDDPDCKYMNENWPEPSVQVSNINSLVSKNDTLILLGDIGNTEWVKKLKGYKVLITGNHDKGVSNYLKKYYVGFADKNSLDENSKPLWNMLNLEFNSFVEAKTYLDNVGHDSDVRSRLIDNQLFDEVFSGPLFINEKVLLSHEPIECGFGLNIHGHVHNGSHIVKDENYPDDFTLVNVCADVINFMPLRLDEIVTKEKVKDLHKITVENAKERKEPQKDER